MSATTDNSIGKVFLERVRTPKLPASGARGSLPGLQKAYQEDDASKPGLNWWQDSNGQIIAEKCLGKGISMVLCDAPGLGKTLSVLAGIVHARSDKISVIFAPGDMMVQQWTTHIIKHFEPTASGLKVYCSMGSELAKIPGVSDLSERTEGLTGGVFIESRPTAKLPDEDVLGSFSVLVLSKDMLSQGDAPEDAPKKNMQLIRNFRDRLGLIVIGEPSPLSSPLASCQIASSRPICLTRHPFGQLQMKRTISMAAASPSRSSTCSRFAPFRSCS